MDELIPVNVVIADRTYRIRLSPADEETVRGSVKLINEKISEFKSLYAGKDMQDYISMVLLWFATEQRGAGNNMLSEGDTARRLHRIASLLDKVLSNE